MTQLETIEQTAPWEEPDTEGNVATYDEFSQFDEQTEDAPVTPEKEILIDEIANEYVGFWNLLVSKTNWEKGKVIHSWRMKLIEAGAPRRLYSDDALAQRIGNVTPQHVGRLRRVYERFGQEDPLPNLFWSHYQAALDWDDAQDWLERASQDKLSVAQTRLARWEATGAKLPDKPQDSDIVDAERDEDVNPYNDSDVAPDQASGSVHIKPGDMNPDSKKTKKDRKKSKTPSSELGEFQGDSEPWERGDATQTYTTADTLNAIKALDELPEDFSEAFQALQVAIVSRKVSNWQDVKPIQIAAYLSEFKKLLVSVEE